MLSVERSRWQWLRSQGLGLILSQATVILLAIGSVVIATTREGASKGINGDDLRAFFESPHLAHTWLYLLVPVMALYALNTLLATYDTVLKRWRVGARSLRLYAASVMHVAFIIALLAHGVGGLFAEPGRMVPLGTSWSPLGDGRDARLLTLDIDTHPNGQTRQAFAQVEVRSEAGEFSQATISYNGPLSHGFGAHLWLLQRYAHQPAAQLETNAGSCTIALGQHCQIGSNSLTLLDLNPPPTANHPAFARVRIQNRELWLLGGEAKRLADGTTLRLGAITMQPQLLLRYRHGPGNPWALAAAVLMMISLTMMWRRLA